MKDGVRLSFGQEFLRALVGSAGIYLIGTVTGFLVGIQLARGLGVAGYGLYGSAMAAASLGATVAAGGLQLHATREVASCLAQDKHAVAARLVGWSIRNVFVLGSIAALAVGGYVLLGEGAALGSRLIDLQSQNMTVAASATAERKVFAHLS